MYKCESCGAMFTDPRRIVARENLDGENGWETQILETCPYCAGEWFEEAEDAAQDTHD